MCKAIPEGPLRPCPHGTFQTFFSSASASRALVRYTRPRFPFFYFSSVATRSAYRRVAKPAGAAFLLCRLVADCWRCASGAVSNAFLHTRNTPPIFQNSNVSFLSTCGPQTSSSEVRGAASLSITSRPTPGPFLVGHTPRKTPGEGCDPQFKNRFWKSKQKNEFTIFAFFQ